MKLVRKAGTVAVASAILFSVIPQAWANDAPMPTSSTSAASPSGKTAADGASVQVEAKISKDEAVAIAKKLVDIPEEYTLQGVSLNSNSGYRGGYGPTWSLNYAKRVKEQYYGNISININADNGKLTNYSFYDNDPDRKVSYPPKTDYKAAKEIAAKWIDKINPEAKSQLLYNDREEQSFRTPLSGSYQYNIRYDRVAGGIPFPQNGISVNVNGEGQVTGYTYNWTEGVTFEDNASVVSKEKAEQAFRDKADLSLSYFIPYQAPGEKKPVISYNMNTFLLNAKTGELWYPSGMSQPSASGNKPLTEKPLGEKPAANLSLTKDQAVERVNAAIKLPDGAKLEEASYSEYTNPDTGEVTSSWNLRWSLSTGDAKEDAIKGKEGHMIWASVNSKTGELIDFNRYMNMPIASSSGERPEPKVTVEEAKTKAIDFVKKNLPYYTDQLVLDSSSLDNVPVEQMKGMTSYYVNFKRVIDGVTAGYENVNVAIDSMTGDIVNYHYYFSNIAYPAQKPEVLPLEKAKELLLSQYDIELSYIQERGADFYPGGIYADKMKAMIASKEIPHPGSPEANHSADSEAKLVYTLVQKYTNESFFLDAATGQWKNSSTGEVMGLGKVKVDDIDGHWAQNELQLMLDYRALDIVDGKVNPDQAITRGELIKMLVIAMNGGQNGIYYDQSRAASFTDVKQESPYFAYVENAVDRGLIDRGAEFNPGAKMNREEMAQLIVRALGYDKLTKYDDIFNIDFADAANVKNVGQVAIVAGLGIMTLTDGSFQPQQEVTKAQAATGFFRYLQKRAELQEQPRYYY